MDRAGKRDVYLSRIRIFRKLDINFPNVRTFFRYGRRKDFLPRKVSQTVSIHPNRIFPDIFLSIKTHKAPCKHQQQKIFESHKLTNKGSTGIYFYQESKSYKISGFSTGLFCNGSNRLFYTFSGCTLFHTLNS